MYDFKLLTHGIMIEPISYFGYRACECHLTDCDVLVTLLNICFLLMVVPLKTWKLLTHGIMIELITTPYRPIHNKWIEIAVSK